MIRNFLRAKPALLHSALWQRSVQVAAEGTFSSRPISHDGSKRKAKQRLSNLNSGDGVCAAYCVPTPVSLGRMRDHFDTSALALENEDPPVTLESKGVQVFARDVVHVPLRRIDGSKMYGHAFFFSSGAAVFWGLPIDIRRQLMDLLTTFQEPAAANSLVRVRDPTQFSLEEFDHEFKYTIVVDGKQAAFKNDEIQLTDFADAQQLLALSYGLAQSVKLLLFEEVIDSLVLRTRTLPDDLAKEGKIRLSKQDLKRLIGELLAARYSINLVSDILDTPEYFWQHADLENLHLECAREVELRERAIILDTRAQVIKDALDILNNELSSSASDRVERAILFLIAVEVFLELARLFSVHGVS